MNPLNQYPRVRSALYLVQWVANGVLSVAGAYFAVALDSIDALPRWYVVALAVAPVLWTYLGVTAQANTDVPAATEYEYPEFPGEDQEG